MDIARDRTGMEAAESALAQAGLAATDVDHIFFTTVTGIASPSIDARLVNRMSMRTDIKRTPIFGLGCVGGAAGIARAADYLRAAFLCVAKYNSSGGRGLEEAVAVFAPAV